MDVIIRKYNKNDLKEMIEIWNEDREKTCASFY